MPRHGLVGQQHELLDQTHAVQPHGLLDVDRKAFLVQLHPRLGEVEVEASTGGPLLTQDLGQATKHLQRRQQGLELVPRRLALDQVLGLLIGEPVAAPDHALVKAALADVPLAVHRRDHRVGEPVLVGLEGDRAVGEVLRQHGDHPVDQVDGGAALECLLVDRASLLHVMAYVRDVNADLEQVVALPLDREGVVEVLGVVRVDREDELLAQIQPPARLGFEVGSVSRARSPRPPAETPDPARGSG